MARRSARRVLLPQDPFWEHYYRSLYRATLDPEVAADLFQKLRIKVLSWTSRYGPPRNIDAVVYTAFVQVRTDWLRRKRRQPEIRSLDDEDTPEPSDPALLADEGLHFEGWHQAVRAELRRSVRTAREAFLVENWDLPAEEAAAALGTTARAVRTARYRLCERFRENPLLYFLLEHAPNC